MGGGVTSEPVDVSQFLKKRVRFEGSTLRSRDTGYQVKVKELFQKMVLPKPIDGSFENIVTKIFEWKHVQEALKFMESNATMGKIVCTVWLEDD
jgi:NADPH:quinone reductase-like Zn-dependent oxidoreductase